MEMGYHFSLKQEFKETNTNSKKLLDLPSVYVDVCPVSNFKLEPEITHP